MGNGVLQAAAVEHGYTHLVSYDKAMKDDHKAAALGRVAELLGEADDPSLSHAFEL